MFAIDFGARLLVVRNVPANVCNRCGERWMSDAMARKLDIIVDQARKRSAQVEVLSLAS